MAEGARERRLVHARLVDIGAGRIAHMDATGIDMIVLSITAPGVQVFEPAIAPALATESNDRQADQKGPDARRRPRAAREAYSLYVERAAEGGNEADGPFSSAC